jgi:hypothetical protein
MVPKMKNTTSLVFHQGAIVDYEKETILLVNGKIIRFPQDLKFDSIEHIFFTELASYMFPPQFKDVYTNLPYIILVRDPKSYAYVDLFNPDFKIAPDPDYCNGWLSVRMADELTGRRVINLESYCTCRDEGDWRKCLSMFTSSRTTRLQPLFSGVFEHENDFYVIRSFKYAFDASEVPLFACKICDTPAALCCSICETPYCSAECQRHGWETEICDCIRS